ncbi:MAG: hypothetical protein EA339_00280 [Rhodobacteraceae bacterium]|nr:MAG: hypothetical protein EA339_00280 [Paracoccaceae bacterium]
MISLAPDMRLCLISTLGALAVAASAAEADLVGHGGPVGALAVQNGALLSGSFDTRAILWDLERAAALRVTRFHDGNVTAVAHLPDGGFVTAGQDGRIALWTAAARDPVLATPPGPSAIASLDVAPDGARIAAGFRDGHVAILTRDTGELRRHMAHADRVTGLGFLPDGSLVSVGGDFRFARWSPELDLRARVDLPDLPNGLTISMGRVVVIFAEGTLRAFSPMGEMLPERFLTDRPLVAVGASGADVAAAAIDGTVWVLQGADLGQRAMFQAAEGPVWALALDDTEIFTAGMDATIRRWSLDDGRRLGAVSQNAVPEFRDDSRGYEVWQACAVCHSLQPGDHARAGPSLHGIFGQPIASQPGYDYSDALGNLDIVWTPQTVAELFEFGPEAYTPGSRMPEQRIANPADREALVDFIARAIAAAP